MSQCVRSLWGKGCCCYIGGRGIVGGGGACVVQCACNATSPTLAVQKVTGSCTLACYQWPFIGVI
jgi:hypothetical protein